MNTIAVADARLGRQLVLDEIFDLSLYRALRDVATGALRHVRGIHVVLEAIEVHGIRKYLRVWDRRHRDLRHRAPGQVGLGHRDLASAGGRLN